MPRSDSGTNEVEDFREGRIRFVTWRTMEAVIGCKPSQRAMIGNHCKDFPPATGGKIDGIECCEQLSRTTAGFLMATWRKNAQDVLAKWEANLPRNATHSASPPAKARKAPDLADFEGLEEEADEGDIGAAAALRRMRTTERVLHAKYLKLMDDDDPNAAGVMKQWKDLIDQLRKMETEILAIEKSRGSLVEEAEMKRYVSAFVMPIKSKLLAMPAQIAEELVGRDAIEMTEILTLEIRKILTELAQWKP